MNSNQSASNQASQHVLILGATSEIGGEIARRVAENATFTLAARRPDALDAVREELLDRGAREVHVVPLDATDSQAMVQLIESLPPINLAVVAFGILGDQEQADRDPFHAELIATTDYSAQVVALTALAKHMREHRPVSRGGTKPEQAIVAFSSIAGFRARRANYVYGSTKAGLDAFCQGLTDALHGDGIALITARPGFVIGNMTEGMKPAPMSVRAGDVADAVVGAVARGRSCTLWIPRKLQALAWVMRMVPRPVWRRMPR